ncbi:hypothetical protein [Baekduia sp. Peel2402]|uniref:hypothetical protein n=1 Tax=Baekduia sp. Peel2402 TaxID=3458296 RepID=UPI00403EB37F
MMLAVGLATGAASGCGGSGGGQVDAGALRTDTASRARPVDLDPEVTGRELLRLQRSGAQMGANDIVKFGSDGSAVVIQAYGGGGEKIRRCVLRPGVLAGLRTRLAHLPLDRARPAPRRKFVSMYVPGPARYTLVAGRIDARFDHDTMPRDARPLVRLLEDTLYGRAADCRVTFRSKVS